MLLIIAMKTTVIVLIMYLFNSSCLGDCRNKPGSKKYKEMDRVLLLNKNEASHRFQEMPLETQIDTFLYARDCADDPRFVSMLVADGEQKIPTIVRRIETESRVWDKSHLLRVLISINSKCKCIRRDSDIIASLERVSDTIESDRDDPPDPAYKQIYRDNLNELKHQLDNK